MNYMQIQNWPTPQIFIPYLIIMANGWSPILAVISDGDRRVHKIYDWTGGDGSKPASGQYIGAAGLVTLIADAVDIRGTPGVTPPETDPLALYTNLGSAICAETLGVPATMINGTQALSNQLCFFMAVWLQKAATLTGVKWYQSAAGDYTANNYNGIGLYSYSGGTLTLRASSTDDGNIWKATSNTIGSKAFSSTYAAAAGVYVVAMLWNRSAVATTPTIGKSTAVINAAVMGLDFTNSAKIFGTIGVLSSLPSPTQSMSGISAGTQPIWVALY